MKKTGKVWTYVETIGRQGISQSNFFSNKKLKFHERTQHILPPENNLLQFYIEDTEQFIKKNRMVINRSKTNILNFTKSRKWDFPPEVTFSNGKLSQTKSETKLVGVIVSAGLKW